MKTISYQVKSLNRFIFTPEETIATSNYPDYVLR